MLELDSKSIYLESNQNIQYNGSILSLLGANLEVLRYW